MPMADCRSRPQAPANITGPLRRFDLVTRAFPECSALGSALRAARAQAPRGAADPGSILEHSPVGLRGSRLCGAAWRAMLRIAARTLHRVRDTKPSRIIRSVRLAEDVDRITGLQVTPGECRIGIEREVGDRERADRVERPDRDAFHSGHVIDAFHQVTPARPATAA